MREKKYYLVELWSGDYRNSTYRLVKAHSKKEAKKEFIKHFTDPNEARPSYAGLVFTSSQVVVLDTIEGNNENAY